MSRVSAGFRNPRATVQYIKHRLQYHQLRLKGEDPESIEFYKSLQNTKVREGEAYPRIEEIGEAQIEFLERVGLRPDDDLLDIGCGDLRGGEHMIQFLDQGSYTGMDISEDAITRAKQNAKELAVDERSVNLLVNDDLLFEEFGAAAFDWVFANSVLTHLPEPDIRECFANLGGLLRSDGVATFSYRHSDNPESLRTNTIKKSNIHCYPFDVLSSWASEYGLSAEYDEYDEHPRENMRMLKLATDT